MSTLRENSLPALAPFEREYGERVRRYTFAERRAFGRYLDDTITTAFQGNLRPR